MKTIIAVLENHFQISGASITALEGYESINYKVVCSRGNFVLKKYPNHPSVKHLLRSENNVLNTLSSLENLDFPKMIGRLILEKDFIYRLLTYVEGEFLGDVKHTPTLLTSFGSSLAKMDKKLQSHRFNAISAKRTPWDLQYFKLNYTYLKYIKDEKEKSLVDYFFLQFDEQVYPVQHQLRNGIIHNDGNDWNVLTINGQVSGIIDFGDMCDSWLINELAVALTYIMMNKENPLDSAALVIAAYHSILPLQEKELDILYYLIAARLCTSVCNSAYAKTKNPESKYITISEQPAWALLRKLIMINPIKAATAFRKAANFPFVAVPSIDKQLNKRNNVLSKGISLSYETPFYMDRSAFQYMYDKQGNAVLDAYNNIMLVGHSHPKVVRAAQRAMAKLNTNTRYIYDQLTDYSERLLGTFPSKLNKVFFVNSGSAASDLAIRLAKTHTKKEKLMVLKHGYHGNTKAGIEISEYKYGKKGGIGKQDFIIESPLPNAYKNQASQGISDDTSHSSFAKNQIIEHAGAIAAFIAEPIVGCGGQVPLAEGYLQNVYPEIRKQGGICISDEVQVGFGRLGTVFWGFEMYNVIPDIVILGKPMGNGHPIGAVVTTSEIADSFNNGIEFFSSFGGNPVSCAIGNAVLEVIETEKLQEHAKVTGNYLISKLKKLQTKFPCIADVRGSGLFLGVEIVGTEGNPSTKLASIIKNRLRDKLVLIGTDGPHDSVLKIKPPLSFNERNCNELISALNVILCDIHKK